MYLLIIRHAEAESGHGLPDSERPLTPEGKSAAREVAGALGALLPRIDLLITSPLQRAIETAGILRARFDTTDMRTAVWLRSETPADESLSQLKRELGEAEFCCLVGHEPNLSSLISLILSGAAAGPFVRMGKATASLIAFPGLPQAGSGTLIAHLPCEFAAALIRSP